MLAFERLIALEGANNVRDLGGYETANGGMTRWRSILRGDALHRLSPADIAALLDNRLATVVDLRNAHEIAAEPNPFVGHGRVCYHNTPLFSALSPVEMMANDVATFDMGDRYCWAIECCQEAIAEVLQVIADAPDGAVLFHCSAGKDRTGVISALLLANAGVREDVIIEDYALTASISGPLIGKLRERALARGISSSIVDIMLASEPRSMRVVLNHIGGKYGAVQDYLHHVGLNPAAVTRLRDRLARREEVADNKGGEPSCVASKIA